MIDLVILTLFLSFIVSEVYSQQNCTPTNDFPNSQVLKTLCLAKDFGWGNITVGGEVTQRYNITGQIIFFGKKFKSLLTANYANYAN